MAGYLIANITVHDPAAFAGYVTQVSPVVAQYGGRYLIRSGQVHPLEGDLGLDRFVVIEFESVAAAQRFYESPDYAPLLTIRTDATTSHVAIVAGTDG